MRVDNLLEKKDAVLEILRNAKMRLNKAGIISYGFDAEVLLGFVLGAGRIDLYAGYLNITQTQKQNFQHLLERRICREPLQYIIGKTKFFGLPFFVEPGLFIPRPETEVLVDAVINMTGVLVTGAPEHQSSSLNLLDLCTGSGCVAISLAKNIKYAKIIAVDISEKALSVAEKNAVVNNADNIEFKKSDLFECLNKDSKFEIIVSNPPYIRRSDLDCLPKEVTYEPVSAIDGGEDGLDFYRKIIARAPEFLKEGGFLVMESGDGQAEEITPLYKKFFKSIEFVKDFNGIDRVSVARF